MNEEGDITGMLISVLGIGIIIGILFGAWLDNSRWKKDAVEKGYAQYNSITGDWEWKESLNGQNIPH